MRFAFTFAVLSLAEFGEVPKQMVVLLHKGEVFAMLEKGVGRLVLYSDGWTLLGKLCPSSDSSACSLSVLETEQQASGTLFFLRSH